ncbi:MAG: phage portal protein [Opitutaceae bacterium]
MSPIEAQQAARIIPKQTMLDRAIAAVSPGWAVKRLRSKTQLALAGTMYRSAEITRLRNDWVSFGPEAATPGSSELQLLRNRSRDANRNDPVASGATETYAVNIVGSGLKPQSRIRGEMLGISDERAAELQRQAETAFDRWKPMADSGNVLDFDEIQFLALRKVCEDGETIAVPTWANEPWRPYGRCLELIESDRLQNPVNRVNSLEVRNGIRFGKRGEPLGYFIRRPLSPGQTNLEYNEIAARDAAGRPKILHVFPTKRPGQSRGIPLFAPVLAYFKDLADYLEAEVVAARVAACLAVFITKQDSMFSAANMATATDASTGARIQGIEPGMVSYLNPGEAIHTVDPKRPGDAFPAFIETVLRLVGTSIGLPYELLVKDFSKTNYSSARAALLEGRRVFTNWRSWFARRFCQPVWDLVLEEAFLRGEFDAKDFYRHRHEYTRAGWIGGGWGWVDPVKEVESSLKASDGGLSTLAEECAGQGRDWEEVLQQRAREQKKIKELGVVIVSSESKKPGPAEDKRDAETE